jgi:hypothetical protein
MTLSGAIEATDDQLSVTQSTRGSKRKLSRLLLSVSHCGAIVSKQQLIICLIGLDVFVLAPTGMGKVFANEFKQIIHYIL